VSYLEENGLILLRMGLAVVRVRDTYLDMDGRVRVCLVEFVRFRCYGVRDRADGVCDAEILGWSS